MAMLDLPTLVLERTDTGDDGTFGEIIAGTHEHAMQLVRTAELPWRNNTPFKSCIPAGRYLLARDYSPSKGRRFHILDVPKRFRCMFHAGNWAGDVDLDKKTDVVGCIAPGIELAVWGEQRVVTDSRVALDRLESYLDSIGGYAWLDIRWADGVLPLAVGE